MKILCWYVILSLSLELFLKSQSKKQQNMSHLKSNPLKKYEWTRLDVCYCFANALFFKFQCFTLSRFSLFFLSFSRLMFMFEKYPLHKIFNFNVSAEMLTIIVIKSSICHKTLKTYFHFINANWHLIINATLIPAGKL